MTATPATAAVASTAPTSSAAPTGPVRVPSPRSADVATTAIGATEPDPATKLVAERLDAFGACWGVLSRLLLSSPDTEVLSTLAQPGQLEAWPLERDELTVSGLALLRESQTSGETIKDLEHDYYALFVGPGPLLAPPYESVHRSIEHLMFEADTLDVRAAYAAAGLVSATLGNEPDDHIGLEFGFLAHLCLRALDQLDEGDLAGASATLDTHTRFLDGHVLVWAPDLLHMVTEQARTCFYRGVAALALGALAQCGRIRA